MDTIYYTKFMLIIGSILQVLKVCESNKNANEFKLYKREY